MKDTPETNEAQLGTGRVSVDFARRLERERDEAREIAAWWRDNWKKGRTMSMIASTELPWENAGGMARGLAAQDSESPTNQNG